MPSTMRTRRSKGSKVSRLAADIIGHRGREQQGLALCRHVRHNLPDIGDKTHVE